MKWLDVQYITLILCLFCGGTTVLGQETSEQSLDELIQKAHGQSPVNDIAETRYLNARFKRAWVLIHRYLKYSYY